MIDLTDPMFHDEAKAREWLEQARWPNGINCVHCGGLRVAPMGGKKHRPGLYHCPDCRGQFTVQTGSVMESSHVPLPKWVLAIRLMTSSKKGFSAHQLHRSIGVTYKTAWFMFHRLREAMADPSAPPIGGDGKIVEADEAYHGRKKAPSEMPAYRKGRPYTKGGVNGPRQKRPIVALVERGGEARVTHMGHVTAKNIGAFMAKTVDTKSRLMTDESKLYGSLGKEFASQRYREGDSPFGWSASSFGLLAILLVAGRGFGGVFSSRCASSLARRSSSSGGKSGTDSGSLRLRESGSDVSIPICGVLTAMLTA